jgi:transposase InsO family protein
VKKRRKRKYTKNVKAEVVAPTNALKQYMTFKDDARPQDGQSYHKMTNESIWVQDFTHLWFKNAWVYVATVIELKTRRIVGWSVSLSHDSDLVYRALLDALSKYDSPSILHSDQGSEYLVIS